MSEHRTLNMYKQDVLDYLEEHKINVFASHEEGYDENGYYVFPVLDDNGEWTDHGEGVVETKEYWGFSSKNGFHTFDMEMNEDQAKYATVLFHLLHEQHNIDFGNAERLAGAFVHTYKVMVEPMSEESQEEVRQRILKCIESGNLSTPSGVEFGEEDDDKRI
mgnify:CR=1 FL=1